MKTIVITINEEQGMNLKYDGVTSRVEMVGLLELAKQIVIQGEVKQEEEVQVDGDV